MRCAWGELCCFLTHYCQYLPLWIYYRLSFRQQFWIVKLALYKSQTWCLNAEALLGKLQKQRKNYTHQKVWIKHSRSNHVVYHITFISDTRLKTAASKEKEWLIECCVISINKDWISSYKQAECVAIMCSNSFRNSPWSKSDINKIMP